MGQLHYIFTLWFKAGKDHTVPCTWMSFCKCLRNIGEGSLADEVESTVFAVAVEGEMCSNCLCSFAVFVHSFLLYTVSIN